MHSRTYTVFPCNGISPFGAASDDDLFQTAFYQPLNYSFMAFLA
jgi:hypothetical protein